MYEPAYPCMCIITPSILFISGALADDNLGVWKVEHCDIGAFGIFHRRFYHCSFRFTVTKSKDRTWTKTDKRFTDCL
ncbi:hypothetical protein BX600DRAFT_470487 [Xylariales sp. PMI_506]|nr:hypothetical protein BX600DRAFT_470487 [Xylariales sp. PMI_506]